MTRYQYNFIKVLEQVILNPNAKNSDIVAAAQISDRDVTDLQFLAQKIVYKMKIETNNTKIAYYLNQLFQSTFYVPRDMDTNDQHQWMQAKEIFRQIQDINEDTIYKTGGGSWENMQLAKYGLHTDNIHVETDGTVLITQTLKSRINEQI